MYAEKTTGWNVRLFLRYDPISYGFWHAYKFCVTQTFRSFWPIVTFVPKGLLRSGKTVPCFPKLITMEITVGPLLLGMGPHIRRLNRKCHSMELARLANHRNRLRYAVCKAMQVLLTQYLPMLLYLRHLVRQYHCAGENANTGVFASEGLQIVICLLDRLNMEDTILKYERTIATALLGQTPWHSAMPGQSLAEEACESLLSSLVTKKGQKRGAVTIDGVDDLHHLISIRKGGHRVNVSRIPNSFVNSVLQRLTAYLNAERVCVPWGRWCPEPTCAIQPHWPRRGVPSFTPSLLVPKGSNHYKKVLALVLLVLTQQGPLKAGFKRKLSELVPRRSVLEEQREGDTIRNTWRRLETMLWCARPRANSVQQQFITPPLLREDSRNVVSKKQLRYLAILHSEPYRLTLKTRHILNLLFVFPYFTASFLAKQAFLVTAEWRARPKRQLRNGRIPTMTLKKRNRRLEHRRRVGRRRNNRIRP